MNKQNLVEKKVLYEAKKAELSVKSYEEEIEAELAKERARLEAKYAAQKQHDCAKVDHYLELLDELILEAAQEEALKFAEEVEMSQSFETVEE